MRALPLREMHLQRFFRISRVLLVNGPRDESAIRRITLVRSVSITRSVNIFRIPLWERFLQSVLRCVGLYSPASGILAALSAGLIGTNQCADGYAAESCAVYRRGTLLRSSPCEDLTLPTYRDSSAKEARLLLTRYEAGVR